MPAVEESIRIDRPVGDVFAFVADADNSTLIMSNLIELESDSPVVKGTRQTGTTRVAGRRIRWTAEVVEHQPDELLEIRSIESPIEFHITWRFADAGGDACDVTFRQEAPDLGGVFGRLGDPVVTRMYGRDVRANLANLKDLLES